jgi:hypothetical protein
MLYSVEDVKHTPPIVRNALRKMRAAEAFLHGGPKTPPAAAVV